MSLKIFIKIRLYDFGCGDGYFKKYKKCCEELYGVELNLKNIKSLNKYRFTVKQNINDIDDNFDTVFLIPCFRTFTKCY